jgi:hypothetical protein
MKNLYCLLLAALFLCSPAPAGARLLEKEAAAKKREKHLTKSYGATEPFYQTDGKGRVVQECWQAPPEGWGTDKALKFARELIPPNLRKGKPQRQKVKGNQIFFTYPKGATIVLSEGPSGIIQIEVHAPGYKGRRC